VTDGQAEEDEPIAEELAEYRGWAKQDKAVRSVISWTTLKDYPTHVGIALEIEDWVGNSTHEIQYWEEARFLPLIGSAADLTTGSSKHSEADPSHIACPEGCQRCSRGWKFTQSDLGTKAASFSSPNTAAQKA
jgi:hypothetical protein